MKKLIPNLIAVATIAAMGFPVMAGAALSPHETISETINGNKITITYGRPYTRKGNTGEVRKIWGALVPWGKVWRTGADQATTLTTEQPLVFGDTTIEKGRVHPLDSARSGRGLEAGHQQADWPMGHAI